MVNPDDTRVIDTNALVESKLREISVKMDMETNLDGGFTDGFTQGINAVKVAELVGEEPLYEDTLMESGEASETTSSEAEDLLAQAAEQIRIMKEEALAQIEQERQKAVESGMAEGRQKGFIEGKKEGLEKGRVEAIASMNDEREKMLLETSVKMAALENEYNQRLDELEPVLVDTITSIYEHIIGVSFKSQRDVVTYLIGNTMRNLEGDTGFLVHVSKDDYPFVSMQKKEIVKGTSILVDAVDIIEDATLKKNECTIETGNGVFDCSLGTQLEALNEELRLLSFQK